METDQALNNDLICAIATPPGQGGVGIVRLSGEGAHTIAAELCKNPLRSRTAVYTDFFDAEELLDNGLALWFPGPNSFTGEDVVELQGHGGPIIQHRILNALCQRGARLARPGEFSERAFMNGKLDLAQAEAVADLISSTSIAASKAALNTLKGAFSQMVTAIALDIANMRVRVEAAIDFPEEDIEILQEARVAQDIAKTITSLESILAQANQGRLINSGISVALIGKPNVGKSSLLNALAGEEAAIVTNVPGTTRDLLKVDLVIDSLPIRLVDTAGLRDSDDEVEKIGIARAKAQAMEADLTLYVAAADEITTQVDVSDLGKNLASLLGSNDTATEMPTSNILLVINKSDLNLAAGAPEDVASVRVSAKTGEGLDLLKKAIQDSVGFGQENVPFAARQRHILIIQDTLAKVNAAADALAQNLGAEFVAEELFIAHQCLGEVTGIVTPDDLLGKIFSEFCIGK
ncbi:tRNA uridine-5-carboxymethylaminomethyl(34) synthesis GTPase MnmE [Pseudomonadales bacterium]|nr:tRNA uridine-5-carboxymethylaminomethyl(34) synthesis GTPase MnmE [Pseudomonadales bacterium]